MAIQYCSMTDLAQLDLYGFDSDLDDEAIAARDRTRAFVDEHVRGHLDAWWEAASFPVELARSLAAIQVYGADIQGHGCAGVSPRTYGIMMRELERGDSGLRTLASVQGALSMRAIHDFGDEAQRATWLPRMATGEILGCFGLSEPECGSNPGGMTTTARQTADGWHLQGAKMWIGNADIADVAIVWAKTDGLGDDPGSARSIRGFLVETDRAGYEASIIEGKYSLRIGRTCRLALDVALPESALLRGSSGLGSPLACLDHARFGIAWGVLGAAEDCLGDVLAYVGEREVFGRPLASFQLTHDKLAGMLTALTQARALAERLACNAAAGSLTPQQISLAKWSNVQMAQDVARTCRDLLGAIGITSVHVPFRHMCNLESVATYEGTRDIHRLVLGQWLTGISAFR